MGRRVGWAERDARLGRQIKDWRFVNRVTATGLARALGISRDRLWDWERLGVPGCDVTLVRLAIRQLHTEKTPF